MRMDVGQRRAAGLRYLTDDRLGEGTVGTFPVSINFFLKQVGEAPFWRRGFEQRGEIDSRAGELVREYDVRTPSLKTPVGRLSGGNIQKVLLARELADGAKVVIFNKPTYGLDLANTLASRQRIRDTAARGLAILLISTDLEELSSMCDRIAVIAKGRLVGDRAERGRCPHHGRPHDGRGGGMSVEATGPAEATAVDSTPAPAGGGFVHRLLMALGPILAALVLAGAILLAVGVDPLAYYGTVLQRGLLSPLGIQQTLTRMAPLLFVAAGLIVAFRAGMWNLGGDGQFLLGAVTAAASAPAAGRGDAGLAGARSSPSSWPRRSP